MTESHELSLTASEVEIGDTAPTLEIDDIQRQDFVRYAGASGDFNPIHYDELYAKESGYESVFGQGMLTAAYAAHMIADWLGLANITRFETRFESQLFPGDSVIVTGEITDIDRGDGEVTVVAAFVAATRDGNDLVTGEAEAELSAT